MVGVVFGEVGVLVSEIVDGVGVGYVVAAIHEFVLSVDVATAFGGLLGVACMR